VNPAFRREVNENCVLLGYCAAISGNLLQTFRIFWIHDAWRWDL